MAHEESLVTSVFKIINLGVLVGGALYLFKSYILDQIKQLIAQEKIEKQRVSKEYHASEQEQQQLMRAIEEQRERCNKMKNDIAGWRHGQEQVRLTAEQEQNTIHCNLEQKTMKQSDYLRDQRMKKIVISQAVAGAEQLLKKRYQEIQAAHEYMSGVINNLQKDSLQKRGHKS